MRLTITVLTLFFSLMPAKAQTKKFRVAIAGFTHESNSFNPAKTLLGDFRIEEAGKEDVLAIWRKSNDEMTGYLEGLQAEGVEAVPTLSANATPKGPLARQTYETILGRLIAKVKAAGQVDGLLLALHGAMVAEHIPHADEETVRRLRKELGPSFPIVVTHDFHANVSPEIVKLSTTLITYKQCPHLDTRERGQQAAHVMAKVLRKQVNPVQAIVKPPMVYNIIYQNTYAQPLKAVTDESIALEKRNPKILAVSVSGGYQYADVPYMGPSVIVVTDGDAALAQKEAQRLSDQLWNQRSQIALRVPNPAQAVAQAMTEKKFPVTLMDTGDNIGGGSAGDSTFLLEEFLKQKATGWVMTICDPEAVQAAVKSGIGGRFEMAVGGKIDSMHGKPVRVRGRVKGLHEGKYIETETRHGGGRYFDQGMTAVIEVEGSTPDVLNLLVLNSRRTVPFSIHQLVSLGIYPERQRILVAKGTIAPRAAYEPVSAKIITVDTPGSTAVNPSRFAWTKLREKLWGMQ
ncbi:MAG: M81 family metallopeptidase [Bryobacteraceae bacterium]|nr:M81 family metallopeptidase [Bryobacteraceae bacterium]